MFEHTEPPDVFAFLNVIWALLQFEVMLCCTIDSECDVLKVEVSSATGCVLFVVITSKCLLICDHQKT
jgi:hypothetical protein